MKLSLSSLRVTGLRLKGGALAWLARAWPRLAGDRLPWGRLEWLARHRVAIAGLAPVVVLVLALFGLVTHTAVQIARFERAEARQTTLIYAAGQPLAGGMNLRALDLSRTLGRLGYVETRTPPSVPGQFRRGTAAWDIVLHERGATADAHGPERVRLETRGDRVTRVLLNGQSVARATLEGEVLTSAVDRPGEDVRPVRFAEVPAVLIRAVLAAEDHRFFAHGGLDLRGVARAAWTNMRAGRVRQGGSTITQQLVKNRLLTPRRTFLRKLDEAWLAAVLEWRYPKDRILEGYLNEIYLGQRGPVAIRGLGAAARAYFGKGVPELDLADAALLAGMIRAPNSFSPALNPRRARERRNGVLARMRELGMIDEAQQRAAVARGLGVRPGPVSGQPAAYFIDFVRQELEERFGDDGLLDDRDVRVDTALDPVLQRLAEAVVVQGLDRVESRYPRLRRSDPAARLQAVLIALDPQTGRVRALVGGRDYRSSQFNRATLARRQPGSAFKPFVYTAALSPGGEAPALTAASFVDDTPLVETVDGKAWSPRNYDDRYEGRVTVRRALEASLNSATVRVAETVGLPAVLETARAMGIEGPLEPVPAMALGAFEVTPLELARAYLPFANGGLALRGSPTLAFVRGSRGAPVQLDDDVPLRVLSPAEAYLMTSLLSGVMQSGTAAAAAALGAPPGLAGKTGTTNDGRDAWFVGYAADLLAVVWVGFDDGTPLGLSGAQVALPLWTEFMKHALDAYPSAPFTVPAGIVTLDIDATNGKLANRFCPLVKGETFLAGTEPPPCTDHGGVADQVGEWWRRLRDWFRR
jgi:penicillin-binding protein 1B